MPTRSPPSTATRDASEVESHVPAMNRNAASSIETGMK